MFYDKLTFIYLEMPKFNKTEYEAYEESLKMYRDWQNIIRTAINKGLVEEKKTYGNHCTQPEIIKTDYHTNCTGYRIDEGGNRDVLNIKKKSCWTYSYLNQCHNIILAEVTLQCDLHSMDELNNIQL